MPAGWISRIKVLISWVVLAAFVFVWWKLGLDLRSFKPTDTAKKLAIDNDLAALAGLLSTTVATATATALGITIKADLNRLDQTDWKVKAKALLKAMFEPRTLVAAACLAYLATGVFIVVVFFANKAEAPETINAFYLSVVGWFLGGFTGTLKSDPNA